MSGGTYDSDPAALEWARGHVEFYIDRLNGWADGGSKHADEMRRTANMLHQWFIGGEGCVIAAFDHRRAAIGGRDSEPARTCNAPDCGRKPGHMGPHRGE